MSSWDEAALSEFRALPTQLLALLRSDIETLWLKEKHDFEVGRFVDLEQGAAYLNALAQLHDLLGGLSQDAPTHQLAKHEVTYCFSGGQPFDGPFQPGTLPPSKPERLVTEDVYFLGDSGVIEELDDD